MYVARTDYSDGNAPWSQLHTQRVEVALEGVLRCTVCGEREAGSESSSRWRSAVTCMMIAEAVQSSPVGY